MTNIKFGIPEKSYVSIKIYNIKGQEIKTFLNKQLDAGYHTFQFNSNNLASGIYFARIITPKFTKTIKMNLIK